MVRCCNVGEPSLLGNDRDNTGDTEAKRLKIKSQIYESHMIERVCIVERVLSLVILRSLPEVKSIDYDRRFRSPDLGSTNADGSAIQVWVLCIPLSR